MTTYLTLPVSQNPWLILAFPALIFPWMMVSFVGHLLLGPWAGAVIFVLGTLTLPLLWVFYPRGEVRLAPGVLTVRTLGRSRHVRLDEATATLRHFNDEALILGLVLDLTDANTTVTISLLDQGLAREFAKGTLEDTRFEPNVRLAPAESRLLMEGLRKTGMANLLPLP